jgi:hypothetical protein
VPRLVDRVKAILVGKQMTPLSRSLCVASKVENGLSCLRNRKSTWAIIPFCGLPRGQSIREAVHNCKTIHLPTKTGLESTGYAQVRRLMSLSAGIINLEYPHAVPAPFHNFQLCLPKYSCLLAPSTSAIWLLQCKYVMLCSTAGLKWLVTMLLQASMA